jgi:hypothetical protein
MWAQINGVVGSDLILNIYVRESAFLNGTVVKRIDVRPAKMFTSVGHKKEK